MMRILLWSGLIVLALGSAAFSEDTVCQQCHAGLEGRLSAPVEQWRESIHAANGISCHDCHGGDPTDFGMAMNPERGFIGVPEYGDVPEFCGRCHIGVKSGYMESAHGLALNSGGPQCVVCHGNHAVKKASLDLINEKDCSRCHMFERASNIKSALVETESMISGLQADLTVLGKVGVAVKDMNGETFSLRNDFRQLFHSVDVEKVQSKTAGFQERGAKIREEITTIQNELSNRKMIGAIIAAGLFLMSIIAFLIRKTYQEDEEKAPGGKFDS